MICRQIFLWSGSWAIPGTANILTCRGSIFTTVWKSGICTRGRTTCVFGEQKFRAKAPCLVLAPPNAAHITNPDAGQICGWKWLYVDPVGLLSQLPVQSQTELSLFQYRISGEDCILPGEKYPVMYELIGMVTRELEASGHAYQGIVRELLGAFFPDADA